jgi:ParB-like chromosome segregation protein Spo0J
MNIQKVKISELKPAPYNPRKSNEKQEANLKASLEKFGVVEPIIFNKQTGFIVGGHFRVRELKKLGIKEVDCVIVDLSPEDEKELNIRLNANTGEWDWEMLNAEWDSEELEAWGLDVPLESEIEEKGKIVKENIKPFVKTHILLSFPPEKMIDIQEHLEKICLIENVEYEQSSN